jgi:tRNA dimethylallyltransferase|tara:strand:- start:42246 stop:43184 length:939 start_codon:yes stop_codon:yes gene_type:complete
MATKLYFIVGPTAVGKTSLALDVAERLGAVILSCDAYCIYRGMDIGTAKPTAAEQSRVPHRGVDLVGPDETYAVDRYLEYATSIVQECSATGTPILVAGGSGFYLKSFFSPIVDQIAIPPELRAEVDRLYESDGLEALQRALEPFANRADATIDWNNPRRVRMALMRCRASDQPLTALQKRFSNQAEPYENIEKEVCLLEREPTELHQRIALRVDQMLEEGLVDEVSKLREDGLVSKSTAGAAIGYRETLAFLAGDLPSIDALREEIIIHTRQLARKQRTWFRKQIPIDRILPAATATPESAFPSALPSAQR